MPIAFVAGATGYTGKAMLEELARLKTGWTARPHARAAGKSVLEGKSLWEVAAGATN